MSDSIRPKVPISGSAVAGAILKIVGRILKSKWTYILGLPILLAYCGAGACTTYVPPNMIGIKQVNYGSNAGIRKDLYGAGLHFVAAGVERLYLFPRDVQVINFSDSQSEVSPDARNTAAIKIQTSDGYNVVLDVTVLYRIVDPYRVFTEAGPGRAFEDKLVIPRADRILRKTPASSTARSSTGRAQADR